MFGRKKETKESGMNIHLDLSKYGQEEVKRKEMEKWLKWLEEKSQEHGFNYVLEIRG